MGGQRAGSPMWERNDVGVRNLGISRRQRLDSTLQAGDTERRRQISDWRFWTVLRAEVGLQRNAFSQLLSLFFVWQFLQRCQTENQVDEFDDRIVIAEFVGDCVRPSVRGDYQQRNSWTAGKCQAVWIVGDDLRRNVIVVALGFIVGDDDGALVPVRTAGYGVDLARHQSFAQLRI